MRLLGLITLRKYWEEEVEDKSNALDETSSTSHGNVSVFDHLTSSSYSCSPLGQTI